MPFIPHTPADITKMLSTIGIDELQQLFTEIPDSLPQAQLDELSDGLTEQEMSRHMAQRAPNYQAGHCFIGAGAYEHYIPAAVWQLASRGEFYTAYTPYQAEASQGSLQVIYEYQTMMCELMNMEVSNASLYDGATALVEAALMATRVQRQKKRSIIVPTNIHPHYQQVLSTILQQQNITIIPVDFTTKQGVIDFDALEKIAIADCAAIIIAQPNFFGCCEAVDQLTDWAHHHHLLTIALVNPMAMSLLKPPGQWGTQGADIACGEGQPLGVPLAYGGPYFGFLCTRQRDVRQLPGRLVARTTDDKGHVGFTLTLQAREQHIRRGKAKSNICTNQGLMVVAATIYMSLMGGQGLREVALTSHQRARYLQDQLQTIAGVDKVFDQAFFHEQVIRLPKPATTVINQLQQKGIQAGLALGQFYPAYDDCLLICTTETKTIADCDDYVACLRNALQHS